MLWLPKPKRNNKVKRQIWAVWYMFGHNSAGEGFFYKYLWKEQNYYFPKTGKISCRMGQFVNTVTLCRVNPEFQLACRNLCLKRIFQKQAALLKSSLEFTIREVEWGEDCQPHPFRTLMHISKRTIFIMKWHTGPSHRYKAFFCSWHG